MNKRKIQGVINRIEDNIVQYKKEIRYYNKNDWDFDNEEVLKTTNHYLGRIDEAIKIQNILKMLKESINDW